jgi:hypothetical protein
MAFFNFNKASYEDDPALAGQPQPDPMQASFETQPEQTAPAAAPQESFFSTPEQPAAAAGMATTQPYGQPAAGQPSAPATGQPTTPDYTQLLGQISGASDPNQKLVLQDQLGRQVFNDLKEAGHQVAWKGDQLMVDGRPYVLGDGSQSVSNISGFSLDGPPPAPGFVRSGNQWVNMGMPAGPSMDDSAPSGPAAAPSPFEAQPPAAPPMDAPAPSWQTPSYAQPAAAAPTAPSRFETTGPTYQPGEVDLLEDFDPLGGNGDVAAATKQSVLDQLAGKNGFSDTDIETMKARSKDELADMQRADEANLRGAAFRGGWNDSRFEDSQENAGRFARDRALIESNRNIDLTAADRRASDARAAVGLGQDFMALQSDNAFKTAALQGDRVALRESINQKAAELGLDADQLQLNYTMGLVDDATRRYGIDVGAQVDREKLAEMGSEFQQDLIFKLKQLEQQESQFGASYGLDLARFNADEDQRAFDNEARVFGF